MFFWLVNSLFILFAVLNINDPDWFLWVPTYLLVAAGSVSYEKKLINKKGMNVLLFFLLFVFVFSFFGFVETLDQSSDTMINISEPNREAVGVLMGASWIFWTSRRQ